VVFAFSYLHDIYKLVNEGDDNWFDQQWKRVKQGSRSLSSTLAPKSAVAIP
jgi:hypothetical protein